MIRLFSKNKVLSILPPSSGVKGNRLKAFKKHKALLGKEAYNDRVANQILSQIGKKKNKFRWIALSVQEAGLTATTKVILGKDRLRKKFGK